VQAIPARRKLCWSATDKALSFEQSPLLNSVYRSTARPLNCLTTELLRVEQRSVVPRASTSWGELQLQTAVPSKVFGTPSADRSVTR
jgi:hypothetical protein